MDKEGFKKELESFINYFKSVAKSESSPVVKGDAEKAAALLEAYLPKIDAGTFGKYDATDLNGALTKGIGDWAWPSALQAEIDAHTDKLFKFYSSLL